MSLTATIALFLLGIIIAGFVFMQERKRRK